jgi:hypothetical protein
VTLAQPLDARALIDAKDGATRHVLDPATVLKPSYLPAGYTGGQATWFADRPGTRGPSVSRAWRLTGRHDRPRVAE